MSTRKPKKNKLPLTEILRRIVLVLSVLVFLSCAVLLILDYLPIVETPDAQFIKNPDFYTDPEAFEKASPTIVENVKELKSNNPDIIGFISIKGTNIDYPIVKGTDNDYYLKHNVYKKRDGKGAIMLDAYSNEDLSLNWLIYGHKMRSKTMFGTLDKLKDKSFFKEHGSMLIMLHDELAIYDVVAACYTEVYPADSPNFKYHLYYNIYSEEDYNYYVANVKKMALYDTGITPVFGEQLVTLSTCRDANSNRRFIVVARKRSD